MLIEAWARVQPRGWQLRIAGPDEAAHKAEVEHAVSASGLSEVVSFVGPALAHGVPVLTTTGTPWSALPERGCGWWVEATADGIAEGLRQATSQDPQMLRGMGERGRAVVTAEFGWERVAKRFARIYQSLLEG